MPLFLNRCTTKFDSPNIIIAKSKKDVAKPLFYLFKKSLDTGTVPDLWKQANVSPLFKIRKLNLYKDFSKASDKVPHERLMLKLASRSSTVVDKVISDR
jgi:hypothetical protein